MKLVAGDPLATADDVVEVQSATNLRPLLRRHCELALARRQRALPAASPPDSRLPTPDSRLSALGSRQRSYQYDVRE